MIKTHRNYWINLAIIINACLITQSVKAQQSGVRVLIIPLLAQQVHIDNNGQQILNHNRVSLDSAIQYSLASSLDIVNAALGKINATNIRELNAYAYLADSLQEFAQFNSFHLKEKSRGNAQKTTNFSIHGGSLLYAGRILPTRHQLILQRCMDEQQFDFVILLNRFEVINRKPFERKTLFSLHAEVYNKQLDKIFGHRSNVRADLSKTTNYSIFKYFMRSATDELMLSLLSGIPH